MRPSNRRRSSSPSKPLSQALGYLIVLLLCVNLLVAATDFYLDHYSSGKAPASAQKQTSSPAEEPKTTAPSQSTSLPANFPLSKPEPISEATLTPAQVQVQIFNGCGAPNLGAKARSALRYRGFDVLSYGNAAHKNYAKTEVIARSNQLQAAQLVAKALGVSSEQVKAQADPNLVDIDVTLILGADYRKLNLAME